MTTKTKLHHPGDLVRDCVSQQSVRIRSVSFHRADGIKFWVYHTTASPDENFPHGDRLENEIESRGFIGPLIPR